MNFFCVTYHYIIQDLYTHMHAHTDIRSSTDVSIARKETTYLSDNRRFSVILKIGYIPKSNKLYIIHTHY